MAVFVEGIQSQDPVVCKDCIHATRGITFGDKVGSWIFDPTAEFLKCKRSVHAKTEYNPVNGKTTTKVDTAYCSTERKFTSNGECGPDGTHWSPRKKQDLFKLIKRI